MLWKMMFYHGDHTTNLRPHGTMCMIHGGLRVTGTGIHRIVGSSSFTKIPQNVHAYIHPSASDADNS
jgi:hypothetical protein